MLCEVNDLAGQHEVIAENLQSDVIREINYLVKDIKEERKKVRVTGNERDGFPSHFPLPPSKKKIAFGHFVVTIFIYIHFFFYCDICGAATPRQREVRGIDQQSGRVPGTIAEELREGVQRSREGSGQFPEGRRRLELVPGRGGKTADEHGHQEPTLRGFEKRLCQSVAKN